MQRNDRSESTVPPVGHPRDATDEQLLEVLERLGLCCARLPEGGFCGATATGRSEGLLVCDLHAPIPETG